MKEEAKVFFDYECAIELFCKIIHIYSGIPIENFFDYRFLKNELDKYEEKKLGRLVSKVAYGAKPIELSKERKAFYIKNNLPLDEPEKAEVFYEFVRHIRLHDPDKIFLPTPVFERFKKYIGEEDFQPRVTKAPKDNLAVGSKYYYTLYGCRFEKPIIGEEAGQYLAVGGIELHPFCKAKFYYFDHGDAPVEYWGKFELRGNNEKSVRLFLQEVDIAGPHKQMDKSKFGNSVRKEIEMILYLSEDKGELFRGELINFDTQVIEIELFHPTIRKY